MADEPIARRTRSQTAATRAANAETVARTRATNQLQETQRLLAEGDRRAARSFARTSATDVIANMTDAARSSIAVTRTIRISERLADEIQRIRNAASNIIAPLMQGSSRGTRRITVARRRQIIEARLTMDEDVSSLYNVPLTQTLFTNENNIYPTSESNLFGMYPFMFGQNDFWPNSGNGYVPNKAGSPGASPTGMRPTFPIPNSVDVGYWGYTPTYNRNVPLDIYDYTPQGTKYISSVGWWGN